MRKNILILDVETANSLEDPLVYDIGVMVADYHGNIKAKASFLIKEIFLGRLDLMESAYYAEKVPSYWEGVKAGRHFLVSLRLARRQIIDWMRAYNIKEVYAYNAFFDRNALNTTLRYLTKSRWRWFFPYGTQFKCIWSMACDTVFQQKTFRKEALRRGWLSPSGKFFSSTAETAYKYITYNPDFVEEHKGLADVEIEYQILLYIRRQKKKMEQQIDRHCFRKVRVPKEK